MDRNELRFVRVCNPSRGHDQGQQRDYESGRRAKSTNEMNHRIPFDGPPLMGNHKLTDRDAMLNLPWHHPGVWHR